ncbi:FecR family protein [Pseudoflavitalea rhizosphaerae]|uniref:FecR family protein n=1 Tax=Pseudoflavitalea rhizosphaerae TaxID=1884793 RepID=UPI000F8F15E7|nr:FecR domain-containing protein [Pseudoflavitalea rhizosphaerae]
MEQERLQKLIDKVLSGQATLLEQQELDQWYAAQDEVPGLTEGMDTQEKSAVGSQLFRSIEQKIQSGEVQSAAPIYEVPRRNNRKWWIAAAVVALLGLGGFYFFNSRSAAPGLVAVWKEVETNTDVRESRLPDGSKVWLNAGSSIRYDTAFSNGKREIWLKGEAYFDVAQQQAKPFEVHTGDITTQVLGTAFNIDAYDSSSRITVIVKSGKVAVRNADKILSQLLPDQRIVCRADGSFSKDSTAAHDMMAWTSGQLIFRDMKFSDVAKRLERKFRAELIFRDASIGNCSITASFTPSTTLEEILDMLALINGSEISAGKGVNQYYISGSKQCK